MFGVIRLLAILALLLPAPAFCEPLNLGEGLIIETPAPEDFIFQTIPSYDASKKMLVHRSGEQLQYFISINRLPRGMKDAEQYFARLIRDLDAASARDSVEIIDQGQYRSESGLLTSYLEYSFTPNGSAKAQHQIAHFMTNSSRTFIAVSVLVDESAIEQMRSNSLAAFRTASISLSNPPITGPVTRIDAKSATQTLESGSQRNPSAPTSSIDADRSSPITNL